LKRGNLKSVIASKQTAHRISFPELKSTVINRNRTITQPSKAVF